MTKVFRTGFLMLVVSSLLCFPLHVLWSLQQSLRTNGEEQSHKSVSVNLKSRKLDILKKSATKDTMQKSGSEPDLAESILQDMHRCSASMGVSTDTLKRKHQHMNMIANKAAIFLDTFWEVVPKMYLEGVRNPCWYSNLTIDKDSRETLQSKLYMYHNDLSASDITTLYHNIFRKRTTNKPRLLCLPSFLIAGFPKSGTTSLHNILTQHPQVSRPEREEPQWWARIPLGNLDRKYLKLLATRYIINFASASKEIADNKDLVITYDGSLTTLIDSNYNVDGQDYCAMASVVHQVLPDAKTLVIMREPVSRMYSHFFYIHTKHTGLPEEMKANPALYFDKYVRAAIKDFQKCLTHHSLFECTNEKPYRNELTTWLGVGIYHVHLLKWLQFWPRENFLFMESSQLATEPYTLFRNMTDFLSLDPIPEKEARKLLIMPKNVGNYSKYEILPETKRLLQNFYAPYNKELEKLTGIKWDYP